MDLRDLVVLLQATRSALLVFVKTTQSLFI